MSIQFKAYSKSIQFEINDGYYKKLKKLGFNNILSSNQISEKEMKDFLNKEYYNILPVIPVGSCSMITGNEKLHNKLQSHFGINTVTIYGYIQTKEQSYHKFSDADINLAKQQNKYFNNHHAWIMFENGQLLDLTFINTLKSVKKCIEEEYEFILSNASKIMIPEAMNLMYEINGESFLKYIPMYMGDLFSQELLFSNASKSIHF